MNSSVNTEPVPSAPGETDRERYILAELEATMPPLNLTLEAPKQKAERKARRKVLMTSLTPKELQALDDAYKVYEQ